MRRILVLVACALVAPAFAQQIPAPTSADRATLSTLRPGHPRLIATEADFQRARRLADADPLAKEWYAALKAQGDRMLAEPPARHVLIGPRLLDQSRAALNRVYTLAALYRLNGDARYRERARQELLAVCAFPNWNPSHFLDVAEMTHAVAIGYDWLYDALSPADRATVRKGIVDLGLKQAVPFYRDRKWWPTVSHNWNLVCNGGITMGALAVADDEPDLAAYIVGNAVRSAPKAMASYAPDGGWAEGPGYWTYATSYAAYFLAALESALGTDFGLGKAPGFSRTALYRLQLEGPLGRTFNFADAGDRAGPTPALLWLAARFHQPVAAWLERREVHTPHTLDLLWYHPDGPSPARAKVPLDAFYKGVNVAVFRGAWDDPNATFMAVKGGDNRVNHSHLDLGAFVLDALGVRWATDLGPDDYNLPGYFGKQRFTYYRLRTIGHNTLTLDGADQQRRAVAPITRFRSGADRSEAVIDLSAAYRCPVRRGVALIGRRDVLIQDEVEPGHPAEIAWTMNTTAEATVNGAAATLRQGGVYLHMRLLSPADGRFEVLPTAEAPTERSNRNVRRLMVRLPRGSAPARIAVLMCPSRSPEPPVPTVDVTPLARW